MWQIGEIGNVDCLWIANLECHRLIKLLLRHLYKVGGWLLTCDLILHWHMDQMPIYISSTMGACQSMYAVLMFGKCNLPIWSLFDPVNQFAQIRQAFYSKVDFFCSKWDNKFSFWCCVCNKCSGDKFCSTKLSLSHSRTVTTISTLTPNVGMLLCIQIHICWQWEIWQRIDKGLSSDGWLWQKMNWK